MRHLNHSLDSGGRSASGEAAIIGLACVFPKAPNLLTYWQNIVSKVDAIDDPPAGSLIHQVYDPDSKRNDRIYCKRGGYLHEALSFSPYDFGIMPVAVDGAMPEQFMALQVARDALSDAGLSEKPFNRERTEVIIGRGTFVNRGYFTLLQHGFIVDQTIRILGEMHPEHTPEDLAVIKERLKASLPPFSAQTAPGLVDSIVAGIIANRLNLKGRNLVVDAACASVLIALEIGIQDLLEQKCDVLLTGGVQISTPHLIHLLFTQLGALTRQAQLRPFDKDADGTMLGEGIGMMVLKRRKDAVRDGHRIYAIIKGVGSSSDGKGRGLVAPQLEGEILALRRAYEAAKVNPDSVELIEAHGTGLPLGDSTEIQALRNVFSASPGKPPRCALGTVKSMIGHLLPASGIAGIIKTALALHHKVLPPTLHCEQPNPKFELEKTPFYINKETRPWIHGNRNAPRRAGVNAFGFGGINSHAVLEEFVGDEEPSRAIYHTKWDTELCLFRGQSRQDLIEQCKKVQSFLSAESEGSLTDIAFTLNTMEKKDADCLAIVASSIEDLEKKLAHAIRQLEDSRRSRVKDRSGIYFFEDPLGRQGKLAFVFPGEGSQYVNMLSDLCVHFPEVRACFDLLDQAYADQPGNYLPSQYIFPSSPESVAAAQEKILQMDGAVDAVIMGDRAIFRLLSGLGIKADVMVGHSSGEIMALEAAGAIELSNEEELIEHIRAGNRMIQSLMASDNIPQGILLAVGGLDLETINQVVGQNGGSIWVSMENCPNQFVLCGFKQPIERIVQELRQKGGICQPLPFSRAYHTPLFEKVLKPLQEFFSRLKVISPPTPLYSCMIAGVFPEDPEEIRRIAVAQWARPVRFRETVETMHKNGVRIFLEIGPRGNLTGFINDILKDKAFLAVSSNVHHRSGISQLNHALGLLAAHGVPMCLDLLYQRRNARRLSLDPSQRRTQKRKERGGMMTLPLSLPVLEIEKEDLMIERGTRDQGTLPVSTSQGNLEKTSGKGFLLADQSSEFLNSSDGAQITARPVIPGTDTFSFSALQGKPMEEYLRTMESFLDVQEQVMLSYLGHGGTVFSRQGANSPSWGEEASLSGQGDGPNAQKLKTPGSVMMQCPSPLKGTSIENEKKMEGAAEDYGRASSLSFYDKATIEGILLTIVSEKTGYPVEMLNRDHNLEAEMGIDSIKRVEILGALFQKIGRPEEQEIEDLNALKTLRQIVEVLSEKLEKKGGVLGGSFSMGQRKEQREAKIAVQADTVGDTSSNPFAGKIVHIVPGREVTAIQRIDLEEHLFLLHHTLGGQVSKEDETLPALPVLPFSMSLEAMAVVASRLAPGKILIAIRNVRAHQWLAFEDRSRTVRIHGNMRSEAKGEIEIKLWIQEPAKNGVEDRLAAEATMVFGDNYPRAPEREALVLHGESVPPLAPDRFYPEALFHGLAFQTVKRLNCCGLDGAEATLVAPPREKLFRHNSNPCFLSEPILTDSAGQVVGLWAASTLKNDFVVFPVGVKEIRYYGSSEPSSSSVTCQVRTAVEDGLIRSRVDLIDGNGSLFIQIEGLEHKRIRMPKIFHLFRGSRSETLSTPWLASTSAGSSSEGMKCCKLDKIPVDFWEADGRIWRTVLAFIILGRKEREVWRNLSGSENRRTEWLLGRAAAKDAVRNLLKDCYGLDVWPADIEIQADNHGRPSALGKWTNEIADPPYLSLSHSRGIAVAAAADGRRYKGVGIDVERLRSPIDAFKKLAFDAEEQDLIRSVACDDANEWWLRMWCAKESVAKSIGKGLLGVPKGIRARRIDPATGIMDFEFSERYMKLSGVSLGQTVQASTFRDSDLIGSIAALAVKNDCQRASAPKFFGKRCFTPSDAENMPFVGKILSYDPAERLLALRRFDLEEDLFLLDHTLGRQVSIMDEALRGLPVMPLTVSMEMMAEAAGLLVPEMLLIGMRDIRAYRWIAFDSKEVTMRVEAVCLNPREVRVRLWDEQDWCSHINLSPLPAVEGTILFDHRYPQPPVAGKFALKNQRPSIWCSDRLYSEGMFHGPQFRGGASVDDWGDDGVKGTLRILPVDKFFRSHATPYFVLDPVLMDAVGQMVAYWFVEEHQEIGFNTYPYRIDAVHFYGPNFEVPVEIEGRVRVETSKENQIKADIQVLGQDGRIRMEFVGWEDRVFRLPTAFYKARFRPTETFLSESCPEWVKGMEASGAMECCRMEDFSDEFFHSHGGIWLRVLAYLALSRRERLTWSALTKSDVSKKGWLLARVAGKDAVRRLLKRRYGLSLCLADIEIESENQDVIQARGKWLDDIPCPPSVSVSCTDGIGVALAAEKGEKCGIVVLDRSFSGESQNRVSLTDEERTLLNQSGISNVAEWILSISCAKQAVEKAFGRKLLTDNLRVHNLDVRKGSIEFKIIRATADKSPNNMNELVIAFAHREADLVIGSAFSFEGVEEKGETI